MAKSDPNRILRRMPLAVGGLGGTLLLINRLMTADLTNAQSRSDALGVILSALLILTGLLWQRVQPRSPDSVELVGSLGFELDPHLSEPVKVELAWASHSLLTNTVSKIVVVWYEGKTLLRRGVLGTEPMVTPGPILQRVLSTEKPVYLVALKLYPGRIEFPYLPENTQGVICQPIGTAGVLIVGADAPRSYTQQDEAWIGAISDKLSTVLLSTTTPAPTAINSEA